MSPLCLSLFLFREPIKAKLRKNKRVKEGEREGTKEISIQNFDVI